jgi:transcriptional regulator
MSAPKPAASLYLPEAFAERDLGLLHDLIESHAFGLLIAPGEGGAPLIAHVPFLVDRERGAHGTLRAHIARANPMRRALDGSTPVVAVFNGPHGYVSPGWYSSRNDVPTWNYAVVHAHGTPRAIEDQAEMLALLGRLAEVNERGQPEPWRVDELSPERLGELLPAIIGFEIEITRLEGKLKLSQNRKPEDREGALRGLAARDTPDDRGLVALMTRPRA